MSVVQNLHDSELSIAIRDAVDNQLRAYGYKPHTNVLINGKMELSYFKEEE